MDLALSRSIKGAPEGGVPSPVRCRHSVVANWVRQALGCILRQARARVTEARANDAVSAGVRSATDAR